MRQLRLLSLIIILFIASACITTQSNLIKAKAAGNVMMDTYHAAYVDVKTILSNPNSTIAQQDLARKERVILVKVKPLLDIYMDTVNIGGVPTVESTYEINTLLNQLIIGGI